jgi:hypothetical protein
MKTKTLLLLCLFLGIGLTQLSAQNGKNGSGTISFTEEYGPWTVPVYCDGVISDYISCTNLVVKVTVHYKNGEVEWVIQKVETQEWTSLNTKEVYKGEAMFDHIRFDKGYVISHGHLIGDKGHNITQELKSDTETWELIDIKSNCH